MAPDPQGPITPDELAKAFANMALLIDTFPCHMKTESKFDLIKKDPLSKESIYLLATYCFDLERRFGYLYRVLQHVSEHAKPNKILAKQVKKDNDDINATGLSWEERAKVAHDAMVRIHNEVKDEHKRRLNDASETGEEEAY